MRTSAALKGWLFCAGLILGAAAQPARAEGTVIAPALAVAPSADPGELLLTELNCAACHHVAGNDALGVASRKSPVLGRAGLRITPQYLRKFLADPAGYKPGTTMPDMLHHFGGAERADAVEALVHFLISLQGEDMAPGTGAEGFQVRHGETLYHTIGCVACHAPQAAPSRVPGIAPQDPKLEAFDPSLNPPGSIPLGDLARKTTVQQLARFLLDPLKVRPSGRMPSLNLSGSEATSIAVYLLRAQIEAQREKGRSSPIAGLRYQYYEAGFSGSTDFETLAPKASGNANGFDLSARRRDNNFGFRYTGSIQIPANGNYTFFTRSDDGSMLYIDGQLVVNNGGDHAPEEKRGSIQLSAGSHEIAVTYYNNGAGYELEVNWRGPGFRKQKIPPNVLSHLGTPMAPLDDAPFEIDRDKANKGRQLFAALGCAACHSGTEVVAGGNGSKRAPDLDQLPASETGCLAANPGAGVPKFDLTAAQRAEIRGTLARKKFVAREGSAKDRAAQTMARHGCYACHTRDGKGGPTDARLAYFRVVGEVDMGDEGRIPPHLTGVGAKLRPEWIHEVLVNHGRVRPYMATRMPQFGSENVAALPGEFEQADARSDARTAPEITQRDAKFGHKLAGTGGLSCISCHTAGGHKSLGIPAIDLSMMSVRLKYDWFYRYLLAPPSLRPGTRMPAFWPNGEAVNKDILGGKTEAQINALWAYLSSKPETDLPDGLVQGRMELVADKEPVIYRNFIQGAGSRAIGVGYPEKVNLAFDANEMRLAMIWQGAFIDAARHWTGRGEGFEPPLGNDILKLPPGPEFAVLESADSPWPEADGKAAGFKMGGYSLDAQRRPAFFYNYKGLRIEEKLEPHPGEVDAFFRRTFTLHGTPVDHLWFRAAAGQIETKGNSFLLNGKTVLRFPGEMPVLRGSGDKRELLVPVEFSNGTAKITEDIIW